MLIVMVHLTDRDACWKPKESASPKSLDNIQSSEFVLLKENDTVAALLPCASKSKSSLDSKNQVVKVQNKIFPPLPRQIEAALPSDIWVSSNGRFAVGRLPSSLHLVLWDRVNSCGGWLVWPGRATSVSIPRDVQAHPTRGVTTSGDESDCSQTEHVLQSGLRIITPTHPSKVSSLRPAVTVSTPAVSNVSGWERLYVSDDGQVVLAQPEGSMTRRAPLPPRGLGVPAPPLVPQMWIWEAGGGSMSMKTGDASLTQLPVWSGTWRQLSELGDDVRESQTGLAGSFHNVRASDDTVSVETPPSSPLASARPRPKDPLAVHFEADASMGRGCVVAHGKGEALENGTIRVQVSTLQQPLRPCMPSADIPTSEWISRTLVLTPSGGTPHRAPAPFSPFSPCTPTRVARVGGAPVAFPLTIKLEWAPAGELLVVTVDTANSESVLGAGLLPWLLLLTPDLQPVASLEWGQPLSPQQAPAPLMDLQHEAAAVTIWRDKYKPGSKKTAPAADSCLPVKTRSAPPPLINIRSAVWVSDGRLLAVMDSLGAISLVDRSGTILAVSAQRSSPKLPGVTQRVLYAEWAQRQLPQDLSKSFSMCAFRSGHEGPAGLPADSLALSDGHQVVIWQVELMEKSAAGEGKDPAISSTQLVEAAAAVSAMEGCVTPAGPQAALSTSAALEVAGMLGRLATNMTLTSNRHTALTRLKLRAALRSASAALTEGGDVHAALHLTRAAAAHGGPGAAALWRGLAAKVHCTMKPRGAEDEAALQRQHDARRVLKAALLQAKACAAGEARGGGLQHLQALTAYWDGPACLVKPHLLRGDQHFLEGRLSESRRAYLAAGPAGLPSLLALQVHAYDLPEALRVLQATWQLARGSRQGRTEEGGLEGRAGASLPEMEARMLAQVPASVVREMIRWMIPMMIKVLTQGAPAGAGLAAASAKAKVTFPSPPMWTVSMNGRRLAGVRVAGAEAEEEDVMALCKFAAGAGDGAKGATVLGLGKGWTELNASRLQEAMRRVGRGWGLPEVCGLMMRGQAAGVDCHTGAIGAQCVVRLYDALGEWQRAVRVAAGCVVALRSAGEKRRAQDMNRSCEEVLNNALQTALTPPMAFPVVLSTVTTALKLYRAHNDLHTKLMQEALMRLQDVSDTLCKQLPLFPLAGAETGPERVPSQGGEEEQSTEAALREQLGQCLQTQLQIMRPAIEAALRIGDICWDGDVVIAGSVEGMDPAVAAAAMAASRGVRHLARVGWILHAREQLVAAWGEYRHAATLGASQGGTQAADRVQQWACQLLLADDTRPPLEMQTYVMGVYAALRHPSVSRVELLASILPLHITSSAHSMLAHLRCLASANEDGPEGGHTGIAVSRSISMPSMQALEQQSLPKGVDVGPDSPDRLAFNAYCTALLQQVAGSPGSQISPAHRASSGGGMPLSGSLLTALHAVLGALDATGPSPKSPQPDPATPPPLASIEEGEEEISDVWRDPVTGRVPTTLLRPVGHEESPTMAGGRGSPHTPLTVEVPSLESDMSVPTAGVAQLSPHMCISLSQRGGG
ncbi:hypothetical protein CYMTET_41927 [Cymbomonas tetramitiformis]|uniref:Uncharacterized protein n=1 Tax=Cymbomonas tetramitiformis TaxID=36881 RepID=A0AAE0C6F6_9CHLO|nr:hypothetical protein CYMTET_41927 [Cymbomonas tetramitiformis]